MLLVEGWKKDLFLMGCQWITIARLPALSPMHFRNGVSMTVIIKVIEFWPEILGYIRKPGEALLSQVFQVGAKQ